METFHKLAGVQDASDKTTEPVQPAQSTQTPTAEQGRQSVPNLAPIPDDSRDLEAGNSHSPHLSHRASRASLPLNRQPSHKSFRSSKHGSRSHSRDNRQSHAGISSTNVAHSHHSRPSTASQGTAGTVNTSSEEFPWGPNHPCFPHPNPHVAPDSPEYQSTRVIRIKRDWTIAGDLYPQYANLYPEILDPLVTEPDFRFLVTNLNSQLKAAFDPFTTRAWLDSVLGVATGYIWDDFGLTGANRGVKNIEASIERWNKERRHEGKEVMLVQVRTTGFMSLDFIVPDPGIDAAGSDEPENAIGPAE